MPSVRAWMASAMSAASGPWALVMTAAIVAVSDALRRRRRISSARRWVTRRARHSRIGTRG